MLYWIFGIVICAYCFFRAVRFATKSHDIDTTMEKAYQLIRGLGKCAVIISLIWVALVFVILNYVQIHSVLASILTPEFLTKVGDVIEKMLGTFSMLSALQMLAFFAFTFAIFNYIPLLACLCFVRVLKIAVNRHKSFFFNAEDVTSTNSYLSVCSSQRNLFLELLRLLA